MTVSKDKAKARIVLKATLESSRSGEAAACALVGVGYALLELAHQVGRVADQVPVWGPPEERS